MRAVTSGERGKGMEREVLAGKSVYDVRHGLERKIFVMNVPRMERNVGLGTCPSKCSLRFSQRSFLDGCLGSTARLAFLHRTLEQ